MKKKILSHTGFMIVLTAILTFIAASFLMYEKFDDVMKRTVRDETEYVKAGMEKAGEDYLSKRVGDNTGTRITLTDENGFKSLTKKLELSIPAKLRIHAVTVVPIFAPIIKPTAWDRCMIPEFTKPTTITVVADED